MPAARRASFARLRNADGETLDHALVLWMPGPNTATGEDIAELHLHGGRGVVAAVESSLESLPELRRATPGEFTRRAFAEGRIDLAQAEGLADLLESETELQRRAAVAMAGGVLSRQLETWRGRVLALAAAVEAELDFAEEDDVGTVTDDVHKSCGALGEEIEQWLARPRATRLKEGYRVVIAGPPNVGKSTLFNRLVEEEAAITSEIAGTTRDVLSVPVSIEGIPFVLVDTAGLREGTEDSIEATGIDRAREASRQADLVLWLGEEGEGPDDAWEIAAQADRKDAPTKVAPRHLISAISGEGMTALVEDLVATARAAMPKPGTVALNDRQHRLLGEAAKELRGAIAESDPLLVAEQLRRARVQFDALLGRATTEDMLDALFGRFCIGK